MSRVVHSIQQLSMIGIAFFLPFHMTFVYPFFLSVILSEIFSKNFIQRQKTMLSSPLVLSFVLFFFIHLIGLIWTTNLQEGLANVNRAIPFLLFGYLWLAAKYEKRDQYMVAFILGLVSCSLLAHYNLLHSNYPDYLIEGIVSGKRNGAETSPFLSHLNYAPILSLGIYFLLWSLLKNISNIKELIIKSLLTILLFSNLIFSTGRAGFLMLIALIIALVVEHSRNLRIATLKLLVLIPLGIISVYFLSDSVKNRVDEGIKDVQTFSENPNSSVGLRYVFAIHSFDLFKENPVFGVGTGDLKDEYKNIIRAGYENLVVPNNPHNQFLMTGSTLGLFGLIILFLMFFLSFKFSDSRGKALVVGFLSICLVESYLWRSNTSMVFIYFISIYSQRESFLFSSTKK